MTYTRSVSDSATMVGSATNYSGSPANGDDAKQAGEAVEAENKTRWTTANSDPTEGDDDVNSAGVGLVERDVSESSSASGGQLTDSPPPSNGATIAHPGGSPPVCQNCGT